MVAIYARQSVDKKDSISIESQIDFCRNSFEEKEYKLYCDRGYSGSNINRPAFAEMMRGVKTGVICKVAVYKLDRISRSLLDFSNIMQEFNAHNIEFVSATEKFDTGTPMGKAMLSIIMVFAQLERETIQKRIKDNYYQRGKNGFYLGGQAPFGYRKIGVRLGGKKTCAFEEDADRSQYVKDIFRAYAYENKSLGAVAAELNGGGVKTGRGKCWSSAAVGRLLRNPVYVKADADVYGYLSSKNAVMNNPVEDYSGRCGCTVYGERTKTASKFTDLSGSFVTLNMHEGLIEAGEWLKCQRRLDKNRQLKNSGKGTHSWLSGIIRCGYCGYSVGVASGGGRMYLTCGGRKLKSCYARKKAVLLKPVEDAAESAVSDTFKAVSYKMPDCSHSDEINTLKAKRLKIRADIKALIDRLPDSSEITAEYLNEKIGRLDAAEKETEARISRLSAAGSNFDASVISGYVSGWRDLRFDEKKETAGLLIDEIILYDDAVSIKMKI